VHLKDGNDALKKSSTLSNKESK